MEIKDQPGFSIKSDPEVIVFTGDFDISFIKMPLIRITKISTQKPVSRDLPEYRGKALNPLRDSDMGNFNLMNHV